nr:uncharacterized protein LOC109193505 [Ipomoea batatas]
MGSPLPNPEPVADRPRYGSWMIVTRKSKKNAQQDTPRQTKKSNSKPKMHANKFAALAEEQVAATNIRGKSAKGKQVAQPGESAKGKLPVNRNPSQSRPSTETVKTGENLPPKRRTAAQSEKSRGGTRVASRSNGSEWYRSTAQGC